MNVSRLSLARELRKMYAYVGIQALPNGWIAPSLSV